MNLKLYHDTPLWDVVDMINIALKNANVPATFHDISEDGNDFIEYELEAVGDSVGQ